MSRAVQGIAKFIYRFGDYYWKNDFFFIESAGESFPSPTYLIERTRTKNDQTSFYVFEYVLDGVGHIECDGKKYDVTAGDFYFLNRLHTHLYYSDREDPYHKIWINVGGRLLDGLVNACGLTDGALVLHNSATREIIERFHQNLIGINAENNEERMFAAQKIASELVLTVRREYREQLGKSVGTAEKIKDFIDSGISYNISLEDIAQHFYLNKSYIISIFSAKYGYTPKQYIIDRKLRAACTMLESDIYAISDISDVLGFSSSQHFSSAFKKRIGSSPDAYRKAKMRERKNADEKNDKS